MRRPQRRSTKHSHREHTGTGRNANMLLLGARARLIKEVTFIEKYSSYFGGNVRQYDGTTNRRV